MRPTTAPRSYRPGVRARRVAASSAAALVLFALAAPVAGAKVHFGDMRDRVVRWDQRVSSTILGCPGNPSCRAVVEGITVYLRRGPVSPARIDGKRAARLGRISARGNLTFRVPHVSPGRYHLVARVPAGSQRRWAAVSNTFRIRRR